MLVVLVRKHTDTLDSDGIVAGEADLRLNNHSGDELGSKILVWLLTPNHVRSRV